jgi:hypothetical protein
METSTPVQKPLKIAKEQISNLRFPPEDVLSTKDQIRQRYLNLEKALTLGNLEHEKIKIIFEDVSGVKLVETTVWGVTDKRIILKQGVVIPIHRIHDVKI